MKGRHAQAGFLNVDLDLVSSQDPAQLLAAFGEAVYVLHSDRRDDGWYFAGLELRPEQKGPDQCIVEFCRLVRELPAR